MMPRGSGHGEGALGHAEFFQGFDFLHQAIVVDLPFEKLLIGADAAAGGGLVLVEKFDAELRQAGIAHGFEVARSGLGSAVEEGVAAGGGVGQRGP